MEEIVGKSCLRLRQGRNRFINDMHIISLDFGNIIIFINNYSQKANENSYLKNSCLGQNNSFE